MTRGPLTLTSGPDRGPAIEALAARVGGRAALTQVLADLPHRARSSVPRSAAAATDGFRWGWRDQLSPRWYPQGITTSADAGPDAGVGARRVVMTSAYAREGGRLPGVLVGRGHGSRLTVADVTDLGSVRYGHVLLVEVVEREGTLGLEPLLVHAGGIAWRGDHLHVAATRRGICTARLSDVLPADPRVTDRLGVEADALAAYGYRWVLPVRRWTGPTSKADRFRFSFLAVAGDGTTLRAGEYGRDASSNRLAVLPLAEDGALGADEGGHVPVHLEARPGPLRMQGAVDVGDVLHVTTSAGRFGRGSLWSGAPGDLREHPDALPPGPEDLSADAGANLLWTLTEHPGRRWVLALDRSRV